MLFTHFGLSGPLILSASAHMRDFDKDHYTVWIDKMCIRDRNKMEIKDIQIAVILDQYMDWMNKRKEMDLEVASEFVAMAAQLVFIKTRMLLSIHDEEALSEMEQLIASLEEHQRHESFNRIKAVIPTLADRNEVGRD